MDCLSNLTDNNVVGVLASILEKTDEAGVPVYGSEVEQVKLGCVAARRHWTTSSWASRPARWPPRSSPARPACEDLPYETIENYGLYINSDARAAELGITVPEDIAQAAQECAE